MLTLLQKITDILLYTKRYVKVAALNYYITLFLIISSFVINSNISIEPSIILYLNINLTIYIQMSLQIDNYNIQFIEL